MKTSMVTTCSHNYCSLCIRKSLMYKAQCPACFEKTFDYQLRNNRILDDIIEVFVRLSDEVKTFLQNYKKLSKTQKKVNTIPDSLLNSNSILNCTKKNNKGNASDISSNQRDTKTASGKLTESTNNIPTSSYVSESENITTGVEVIDIDDFERLKDVASVKQPHQSPNHKRIVSKGEVLIPSMFSPRKKRHNTTENLVPCPVCSVDIPEKNINIHLDVCLKRSEQSSQHGSPIKVKKRNPLPKLVYSLLQEKELRKMLKQRGLSTHGDRKALITRHQRFTLLYNSECDTLNPRSSADIIKQVEKEEQEEKKACSAATISNKMNIDRKTDPNLIEQVQQQYLQENKTSFENLIQSIRKREAEKKTAVKCNLSTSDEEDDPVGIPEDCIKETRVQKVTGQKTIIKGCVVVSDEEQDVTENGYGLHEPSVSTSSMYDTKMISNVGENMNCNEVLSETTSDTDYEGDMDEAMSPVLGRNTVTNSSRRESEIHYEAKLTENLTPDMFEKSLSVSSSQKCSSSVKHSEEVEQNESGDEDSNQSFSLLTEYTQDEKLATRRMPKRLNSQLDDPDFEPDSEELLDDFEIRKAPIKKRRNTRKSPQPSSRTEGRILRNHVKH